MARASGSSKDDFEQEMREQIRQLAEQGWTFKKPASAPNSSKRSSMQPAPPSDAGVPTINPTVDQATASRPPAEGPSLVASSSTPLDLPTPAAEPSPPQLQPAPARPTTPHTTRTSLFASSQTETEAAGAAAPVEPAQAGHLTAHNLDAAATDSSTTAAGVLAATSLPDAPAAPTPTTAAPAAPTPTTAAPAEPTPTTTAPAAAPAGGGAGGAWRERLGYQVATGTDLPGLIKSIIGLLNKDDSCWVAAVSPSNCTLALQAITSARKAAIHAGLFEIVMQPCMTPPPQQPPPHSTPQPPQQPPQSQSEPRLEFFLSKFELDGGGDTLVEEAVMFPGAWPADDGEFGRGIVSYLEQHQTVKLRCGGSNHSSQAVRALVAAQDLLAERELELQVSPEWHVGEDKVVRLDLLVDLVEVVEEEEEV